MRSFIKIEIDSASTEEAEILIADLSEDEFYAFEHNESALVAYIKGEDFSEEKLRSLLPEGMSYRCSVIEDKNWNAEWEKRLEPVIIEDFAGIRASFHKPMKK